MRLVFVDFLSKSSKFFWAVVGLFKVMAAAAVAAERPPLVEPGVSLRLETMLAVPVVEGAAARVARTDTSVSAQGMLAALPEPALRVPEAASNVLTLSGLLELALSRSVGANQEGRAYQLSWANFERVTKRRFVPKQSASLQQRLDRQTSLQAPSVETNSLGAQIASKLKLPSGADVQLQASTSQISQSTGGSRDRLMSLTLSQPLLRGAGFRLTRLPTDIAALELANARVQLERVAVDTLAEVIRKYFDHEQARIDVAVLDAGLDTARKLNAVQTELVAAGRLPRSVLLNSESDIAGALLSQAQARNTLRLSQRALLKSAALPSDLDSQVLGADIEPLPLDRTIYDLEGYSLDDLRQAAARFSPELQQATNSLKIQQYLVDLAEDDMRGSLSLDVGVSRRFGSGAATPQVRGSDVSIGLVKTFEFDKTERELALARAKMALQNQQDQTREIAQQMDYAVFDAFQQYQFSVRQYQLAQAALRISRNVLASDTEKLRLGRVSAVDLTSAQVAARNAESQANVSRINTLRSALELYRLTGMLLSAHGLQERVEQWILSFER